MYVALSLTRGGGNPAPPQGVQVSKDLSAVVKLVAILEATQRRYRLAMAVHALVQKTKAEGQ